MKEFQSWIEVFIEKLPKGTVATNNLKEALKNLKEELKPGGDVRDVSRDVLDATETALREQ
jgi:hypothetical protein